MPGAGTTKVSVQPSGRQQATPESPTASSSNIVRLPVSNPMTDEELVAAIASGDEKATDFLYDRVQPAIDRNLCRVLGRRDDEYYDLFQIVFERVIISIVEKRFDNRCCLATWASSIASYVGIDAIRARQRRRKRFASNPDLHLEEQGIENGSVEAQLEARSDFALVRQALAQIDPKKAKILALHHLEGHAVSEIAAILGTTYQACQSQLVRGRRQFLQELEKLERGKKS